MIAVVAVLALRQRGRYYLVITLGERVVADLGATCSRISLALAGLLRSGRSGEMVSRLTADTTQIKSAVGASVSIALRNVMLFSARPR